METKFRLKKEARQFFSEIYHKEIQPINYWNNIKIHKNLLSEVEPCYIDYGHEDKLGENKTSKKLSRWSYKGEVAEFMFTLKVLGIKHKDYDIIKIAELMDEMQKVCNKYFKSK